MHVCMRACMHACVRACFSIFITTPSLFLLFPEHPLSSWPVFCEGHAILAVLWSRSRPAVFFVLAENSTLYTFDLVETGLTPVKADHISSGRSAKSLARLMGFLFFLSFFFLLFFSSEDATHTKTSSRMQAVMEYNTLKETEPQYFFSYIAHLASLFVSLLNV